MKLLWIFRLLLGFGLLLGGGPVMAAGKVALVVGIQSYENVMPLRNPNADAEVAAKVFTALSFQTTLVTDPSAKGLRDALAAFRQASAGSDLALIYYAGHGVQIDGQNYILATDTRADSAEALFASSVELAELVAAFAPDAGARFLIVDACRDNPFAQTRAIGGAERGLARGSFRADDMLIFYSAQPNETALDGTGTNSPFLLAMQDVLTRAPTVKLNDAVIDISHEVRTVTRGRQIPYVEGSLTQHLLLAVDTVQPPAAAPLVVATAQGTGGGMDRGAGCPGPVVDIAFPSALRDQFLDLANRAQSIAVGGQVQICVDGDAVRVLGAFEDRFNCADVTDPERGGVGYYFATDSGEEAEVWLFVNTDQSPRQLEVGISLAQQEVYWLTTGWPFCGTD